MIGSPGTAGNTGRVNLIFGQAASTSTLTGAINLTSFPSATIPSVIFTGASAGALAGFALSQVGSINTTTGGLVPPGDTLNEIDRLAGLQ